MKLKIWQLANKTAALIIGVLVVIFMFASQQIDNKVSSSERGDQTEQSSDEESSDASFIISADWVTSISTTQIQPILNWIRNIELPENPIVHVYEIIQTGATQFFQTLFQQIISPNAP